MCAALVGCALPSGMNPIAAVFKDRSSQPMNKKFARAKRELKNPTNVHLKWARLKEEQGQAAEARQSYQFVLDEQPKSIDALLGLARLDQLAGRTVQAEQGFRKALQLKPNEPRALGAVGQFYASQKRWNEAVEMLQRAMIAAPEEKAYRYHLAVALARSGDIANAMPHFSKTVGDAQAHYNVGYILYEQGQLNAAKRQMMQAVVKKPDLLAAQQMLDTIRHDQEDKLMLAGAPPVRSQSTQPAPAQQATPANYAPRQQATPIGHQPAASGVGHQPAATENLFYPPQTATPPTQPPFASPAPAGLTPQQIEQLKNQFDQN